MADTSEPKKSPKDRFREVKEKLKVASVRANIALQRASVATGARLERGLGAAVAYAKPQPAPGLRMRQIMAGLSMIFFIPIIFIVVPVFHDVMTGIMGNFGGSIAETLVGTLVPFLMLGLLAGSVYAVYFFVRRGGPGVFDRKLRK